MRGNGKEASAIPTDDELYGQYLAGGLAVYDELMLRYGDSLTMYLSAVLHDWHDAEDMMIEAFARIMVKRPAIRAGGFKAYLFKTGRNLAVRFASRRGRTQTFALEAFEEEVVSPEPTVTPVPPFATSVPTVPPKQPDAPRAPMTGDDSLLLPWVLMLCACGLGLGAALVRQKKRRDRSGS